MLKLYLAALLLSVSVSAGAGKYTYPSMGNTDSQGGVNRVESDAKARDGGSVYGGKVSNQGEQPISDQAIEEHSIGGLAAELDKKRHEQEAKCAAEAKQHKYDPNCD